MNPDPGQHNPAAPQGYAPQPGQPAWAATPGVPASPLAGDPGGPGGPGGGWSPGGSGGGRIAVIAAVAVMVSIIGIILIIKIGGGRGFGGSRELALRSKCGKNANQLAVAQMNYATSQNMKGQPEAFVRGTEGFCRPDGKPLPSSTQRTDGSRAFVHLAKNNYLDSLGGLACPSDPFVAVLQGNAGAGDFDIPAENVPAPAPWDQPGGAAATESGHTFYSYSMQAGSKNVMSNLGPKMLASLPLFSERNPWSDPLTVLAGDTPTNNGYVTGNPWNHNRDGFTAAQRDGTTIFMTDAREFMMPVSASNGASIGYDYVFGDGPVSPAPPGAAPAAGAVYTGVGGDHSFPRAADWGCFMFD